MEIDSVQAQEPFECFGIPLPASADPDASIPPAPPGWGRRNWLFQEAAAAMLGAEALPSPPLAAAVELDIVR